MFHILLIDGSPDAAALVHTLHQEPRRQCKLHLVADGAAAMHFLNHTADHAQAPSPDLVILNLELPQESGLQLLSAIKSSVQWCALPVIAMSTADPDAITRAYALHANCCIVLPGDALSFAQALNSIEHFWTRVAKLPAHH